MAEARYLDAHLVSELVALKGRGKVTYPSGNLAFPQIERVLNLPVKSWSAAYLSTDQPVPGEPTGCVLTVQQKLSSDDHYASVYRLFETLPGPWVYGNRFDDDLGYVRTRQRAVATDIVSNLATESATGKTTFTARDGSTIVSIQNDEFWGDGSGTPDGGFPNAAYPQSAASTYDVEKGAVSHLYKVVASSGQSGSLSYSASTLTEITYETLTPYLLRRNTQSYALPGPILTGEPIDDFERGAVEVKTQLVARTGAETTSITLSVSLVTETTYENVNALVLRKRTETYTVPGPLRTSRKLDDFTNSIITETRQLVAISDSEPSITDLFSDFQAIDVSDATKRFVVRTYPSSITSQGAVVEYVPTRFVYPAIWHGLTGTITSLADLQASGIYIEAERPMSVSARHETTFTATAPTNTFAEGSIVNFLPIRHERTGIVSVLSGPVLSDAFTIGAVTIAATSPSASSYLSARGAGSFFIQGRAIKKIANGLWSVVTIYLPYR